MDMITFLIVETVVLTLVVVLFAIYWKRRDNTSHHKLSIGEYTLVKKIGEGGMSEIYLARYKANNQQVVIKILHSKLAVNKINVKRFLREGKNLKKIKECYPNSPVVKVYDYGLENNTGRYFIVMEYLSGESLKHIFNSKKRIDFKLKLHLIKEVAKALRDSHSLKIYHRDVSPENIIINGKRVTLIDFGIAKDMTTDSYTSAGNVLGKIKYTSPEQFNGDKLTDKSDIYSLGVVSFYLFEGRPPYDSQNPYKIINMHQSQATPEIKAPAPEELKQFIYRMMDKSPIYRPNAREVSEKMRFFLKQDLGFEYKSMSWN